jgi:UDP-N-acetylglucosamine 2-epimerase (non-hydrolysing)
VLVVGDVNSTLACSLAAVKLGIKVAHVEAGLRSMDRTMPEEINRIVTDHVSDFLFVSEEAGQKNLKREGIEQAKIFFVGNVMIDTLMRCRGRMAKCDIRQRLKLKDQYSVLTLHRPASVDDIATFERILTALETIQKELPIVFPVHPRTRQRIAQNGLAARFAAASNIRMVDPMGYVDFMALTKDASLVLSDSGGIQEETCILGVPCITLRENTERPSTLGSGFHALAGYDPMRIVGYATQFLAMPKPSPFMIPLWDGHAAERIVEKLVDALK